MKADILFLVLLLCLFSACESSSSTNNPADQDFPEADSSGDEDSIESEMETTDGDVELIEDELADSEVPDGDPSDGDRHDGDDIESDISDGDSDTTDMDDNGADGDAIGCEQSEIMEYPPLIVERLPFDGVSVQGCGVSDEGNHGSWFEKIGIAWGDGEGLVYLSWRAGLSFNIPGKAAGTGMFWEYDEINNTLTCDPAIEKAVFAMDGRTGENGTVIWAEQKDKLARRSEAGDWNFVSIPDVAPRSRDDSLMAGGLQIGPDGWIAVWGNWGLGFYNDNSQTWSMHDFPVLADQPYILEGRWRNGVFYMPVGCTVLSWTAGDESLAEVADIRGCKVDEGEAVYAIDLDGDELKLAQVSWRKGQLSFGALSHVVTLNMVTEAQKRHEIANLNHYDCGKEFNLSFPGVYLAQHIVPGMSGMPPASLLSGMSDNHNGFQCNLSAKVRLGPTLCDTSCETGETGMKISWPSSVGSIYCHSTTLPWLANTMAYPYYIGSMLQNRAWRDGETMWLGATRVSQANSP